MRADLGLDDGLSTQFGLWTRAALRGDLGLSMRFGTPVADMLVHALPASLKLAGASLLAGLALGMGLAVLALAAPRSPAAAAIESLNVWSIAVPTFCTGVLGILAFSIWLGWLPIRGQMLLPVLILAWTSPARSPSRCTRNCAKRPGPASSAPRTPRACRPGASPGGTSCPTRCRSSSRWPASSWAD